MSFQWLKRPLYVVGTSFGLSLLAATAVGFHTALIAAVLCALLFLLALAVRRLRRCEGVWAALLAAGAAFTVFVCWESVVVRPLQQMDGQRTELTFWVEETVSETARSSTYFARVREGTLPHNTRVLLRVAKGNNAPQLYDFVRAKVQLEATDEWRAKNVFLAVWVNDCQTVASKDRPWDYRLMMWRTHVIDCMETKADGDVAALLRAVCFGDKTALTATVKANFAAAGLSHITAVSGFHMSVVAMGFFALLRRLKLPRRRAALLALPIPFVFAAVTGFALSALRAAVMTALMLLGELFRRAADGRNSLGAAVLCLLLCDITAIYDLGFQLSVAATWGLLLASSLQPREKHDVWHASARALQLTVAAVVATLPISALHFGETSALSPLTNLVGQPLAGVVVNAGLIGSLLMSVPWFSFIGAPLILVAGVAARGLLWLGEAAAFLPFSFLQLREPHLVLWALAVPFALLLGWQLLKARGLRITAMLLVIAFCVSTLLFRFGMRGVTSVAVTNVNGGSVVLFMRNGRYAAVLTGEPEIWQTRQVLKRHGVEQLDVVLFSVNGKAAVQTPLPVKELRLPRAAERLTDAIDVALWENSKIHWQDGWCYVTFDERSVLIAPCNGTVQEVLPERRLADVAIFDRDPPQGAGSLALGELILCCSEDRLPLVADRVPWGIYPITVTADETVTVKLR